MKNEIYIGDCREVLKTLPVKSVHCCVTSPPYYGLRDYGVDGQIGLEQTPEEYVSELVGVFREVKRVLRDDGTVWLNLGDSYSGGGCGGDPKHKKDSNSAEKTAPSYKGIPAKNLIGIPWRVAFALQADGWYLRQDIIWQKNNPMPESVRDRCTKAHEYIFLLAKSQKYYFDNVSIQEDAITNLKIVDKSAQARGRKVMFGAVTERDCFGSIGYSGDGTKRNKRSVWQVNTKPYKGAHFATFPSKLIEPCILAGTSEHGVCSVCGSPYKRAIEKTGEFQRRWSKSNADGSPYNSQESMQNTYETVGWQPSCSCNAPSIPATVLDPFGGSGTVGEVCHNLGRNALLVELNPAYAPLIEARAHIKEVNLDIF